MLTNEYICIKLILSINVEGKCQNGKSGKYPGTVKRNSANIVVQKYRKMPSFVQIAAGRSNKSGRLPHNPALSSTIVTLTQTLPVLQIAEGKKINGWLSSSASSWEYSVHTNSMKVKSAWEYYTYLQVVYAVSVFSST